MAILLGLANTKRQNDFASINVDDQYNKETDHPPFENLSLLCSEAEFEEKLCNAAVPVPVSESISWVSFSRSEHLPSLNDPFTTLSANCDL